MNMLEKALNQKESNVINVFEKTITDRQKLKKIKDILENYEEMAEELLENGNSKDTASGEAYVSIIYDIKEILL